MFDFYLTYIDTLLARTFRTWSASGPKFGLKDLQTRNEHFSYTPGGTNTLARLLKKQTLQLNSWRNELFSLVSEGMNSLAQLLKVNGVKGSGGRNKFFSSAPGRMTLSSPSITVCKVL
ncbi:hypothetical protein C1645_836703 [Glomus cerebriforme]|uniref:Uncharacterized protein n=1 Tax=Glomus cerebriforme TaxID=658196 RepID=A0A397SC85_9GLOM|nr:hypothetical protein C1645_836703 [Glomus cerebriforme]